MPKPGQPLDVSKTNAYQKEQILGYALHVRNFEIERFWQRSLFFWGFIGAAFVAYAQLAERTPPPRADLEFLIACFGVVCSFAWTLQNRGSKYWYEAWEAKVESVEEEVLGTNLFSNPEPLQHKGFWGARNFSVSKLAIALSDFTAMIWIVLAARAFPADQLPRVFVESFAKVSSLIKLPAPDVASVTAIVTSLYVLLLFMSRRS